MAIALQTERSPRRWRAWHRTAAASVFGAALWAGGTAALAAPQYSAQLLGTSARDINNAGQVVGSASDGLTVWSGAGASSRLLADFPNDFATPQVSAINASGVVVGGASGRQGTGIVWRNGGATGLPGFYNATDINDAGVVVGSDQRDFSMFPVQWVNGVMSQLPGLPASAEYGAANAINNAGAVVGWAEQWLPNPVEPFNEIIIRAATLWLNGIATPLGVEGEATDINDLGQVVGQVYGADQAFLWTVDGLTLLDPLWGAATVEAINDQGLVVGRSTRGGGDPGTATLWESGRPVDLNALLRPGQLAPEWTLVSANGINDLGWVVGDALNSQTGERRGFLLTPQDGPQAVPEPPVLALLGLGLAVLLRRRPAGRTATAL